MAVDATDLIAWWSCDEASGNLIDAHGSNDGVETSGTIGSGTGKIGGSRVFVAGDTEYFQVPDSADISFGDEDWSGFMWLKPATGFEWTNPFAKGTFAGNLREYHCEFFSNQPSFYTSSDGTSAGQHGVVWGSAISADVWSFIAFGHSAASDEIWISVNAGTPVTTVHTGGTSSGASDLIIGAYTGNSANYAGDLDEMAFYRRDIRADLSGFYNSGNGVSYADVSGGAPSALLLMTHHIRK